MTPTAEAISRLDRHHDEFLQLVREARRHLDRGRWEAAAATAQMAGQYAWMNHTGRFASPDLEQLLAELGARLAQVPAREPRPRDVREVLHVVTQCYGTGGSTQAIACWIEQDGGRRHRVCITRQRGAPPPEKIVAPLASPSDLIRLDTRRGGLMERAAHLRALAAEADVVLLHLHPYDIVPAIAFGGATNLPPVIYVDHCDHVFWLGMGISNVVMHMRDSGRRLAATRRGLEPERSAVVARPLRLAGRTTERDEAKRKLGINPAQTLIVTAADGSKYRPVDSTSLVDLVARTLEHHPDAILLAAGPRPEGEWAEAHERTGGRVRALGPLPDVKPLHEAADVYLDSFPFSSLTSLLEAGNLGVPALTYRGHAEDCGVLGADTRGVDEHLLTACDPEEFVRVLGGLIDDAATRRDLGARMEHTIRDTHTGAGWLASVEDLYALAATAGPPTIPPSGRDGTRLDVLVDLVMTQTGFAQGVPGVTRDQLALLPVRQRVGAWRRLTRAGLRPPHGNVVPEWLLAHLWRCRKAVRDARASTARLRAGLQRRHA